MNKKIKILVASHKKVPIMKDKIYVPIQVGKKLSKKKFPFPWLGDDTGDNISEKNKSYCELTALYWAWKNYDKLDNPNYVGLCHYRRYFYLGDLHPMKILRKIKLIFYSLFHFSNYSFSKGVYQGTKINLINKSKKINLKIKEYVKRYNLILPKKIYFSQFSIKKQYATSHNIGDLNITMEIIRTRHPTYLQAFNKILNQKNFYCCNMFIMDKNNFNKYCKWLFDILFNVEKKIKPSTDIYQQRVYGFLGERLLNVYIEKNKKDFKIKEMDTIFIKK